MVPRESEEASVAINEAIDNEVAWLRVDSRRNLPMPNSDALDNSVREAQVRSARHYSNAQRHMKGQQMQAFSDLQARQADIENLRAKARAQSDVDDIGKVMARALCEAEFQEEQARASLGNINAELSAHERLGEPRILPHVQRDEGDSSAGTALGHRPHHRLGEVRFLHDCR